MVHKGPWLSWPCGEGAAQSQGGLYGSWARASFTSVLGRAGALWTCCLRGMDKPQELCGAGSSGAGMTVCWGWRGLGGLQRGLAMEAGALPDLLSFPQLNIAKSTWPVLSGFQEGPLNFPPTFKFDVGTNKYDSR